MNYNIQSSGIGDLSRRGKNVRSETTEGGVSNAPVSRTRFGATGLGTSEFESFEMRAFLTTPVSLSSIHPVLILVGMLQIDESLKLKELTFELDQLGTHWRGESVVPW